MLALKEQKLNLQTNPRAHAQGQHLLQTLWENVALLESAQWIPGFGHGFLHFGTQAKELTGMFVKCDETKCT